MSKLMATVTLREIAAEQGLSYENLKQRLRSSFCYRDFPSPIGIEKNTHIFDKAAVLSFLANNPYEGNVRTSPKTKTAAGFIYQGRALEVINFLQPGLGGLV